MDIWEKMYEEAQKLYNPHEVSDFVYANHVVAAVEAEDGKHHRFPPCRNL